MGLGVWTLCLCQGGSDRSWGGGVPRTPKSSFPTEMPQMSSRPILGVRPVDSHRPINLVILAAAQVVVVLFRWGSPFFWIVGRGGCTDKVFGGSHFSSVRDWSPVSHQTAPRPPSGQHCPTRGPHPPPHPCRRLLEVGTCFGQDTRALIAGQRGAGGEVEAGAQPAWGHWRWHGRAEPRGASC